ncbi:Uncharacterized protein BP5553_04333 [Venustampulla echinocandica]|uniref:Ribosome biogenesis protein Urb1 n=1 Tax=Venustampulla echinocandica TaxID=2656787 RepID=A0A370TWU1_9HELO|nr:Uncharacterized protein BP5553_04333 [Venustampulla echinocandica]RDL39993.1 Uncharacterized protein BP5553_04333 [Venustampulla echinocandica]
MAKRSAEDIGIEDGDQAYLKRQKITNPVKSVNVNAATEINSGKQLRQLVAFDQDHIRAKHGIQSFKNFLDGFANPDKDIGRATAILKDYLDSHKPEDENDKTAAYLPDLMQTWSYAAQSNDESLLSAVPAVLALLLKTLSNVLEFSEHGLRLCRTMLQRSQLELISRGLTANKNREFLISPVLRLLKELSTFDGGALAKQVFRARDHTLKGLGRNLNLRFTGDGIEDVRRPSVRTNALRFILPIFKFLPVEAKRELLNQRDIASNLTRGIEDDPAPMVREILTTLKTYVLQDEALPRDAKTKVVNAASLGRIALLYGYEHPDGGAEVPQTPVNLVAHEFLVSACTSHDFGVLNHQTGFYPRGIDPDDLAEVGANEAVLDLGLDSIEWMENFTDQVPIRNTILSDFIQTLRPWSSTKQRELLISVFRAAPELVAEYFFNKKSFSFDPKLTATWIGYSAFLFSSLQLPLPEFFGHSQRYARLPPPHSIVLESILPQPLSQKVLRGCLLQPEPLIKFFAVRLLCIAFSKFKDTLRMYHNAADGSSQLWTQAATLLTEAFCKRCPSIKDVIHGFRNMTDDDLLQREAITKLLVLYYEVVPSIALEAKFDVSGVLSQTLHSVDKTTLKPQDRALRAMELENLFQFAHFSPGMRWFATTPELPLSPFMAMLKLSAEAPEDVPLLKLRSVLASVIEENQILQTQTKISALDSFILRLRSLGGTPNAPSVYTFLDDCISRCAAKPIKYIYALEEIQAKDQSKDQQRPFSLLTLAITEQWPFMIKSADDQVIQEIAQFVAGYLATCIKIKENKAAIKSVIERLATETPVESPARKTIERSRKLVDSISVPEAKRIPRETSIKESKNNVPSDTEKAALMATMLEDSKPHGENHNSLIKWTTKEVDEVVEGGHAASLIMLMSSEYLSVRKEALTNISKFATKLNESSFEEKEQIWLLLSEVVETAKKIIDEQPLPTVISAFAAHAIPVLNDPLHILYPKINKFLSQGPTWELEKIPLMYKILDEAPSLDDAYYPEMSWLLTYMLAGLRTAADMAIYRKRRVFEKLFSIWNSAYLAPGLRDKILRILFRATTIEGGSTTLITRFSTMTWLQAQVALGSGMSLKVLMERILETSDQQRVKKWARTRGVNAIKADTLNF